MSFLGSPARSAVAAILGVAAAGVIVSACATGQQNVPAPVVTQELGPPDDRLSVDDMVDVRVFGEPDMTGPYRIGSDGTFDFPLAGRIVAQGRTIPELQAELVKRLKGPYLRDPQVTVMWKERNARRISVLGQVQHPGPIPYYQNMTIVDAVASAGGFTPIAAKNSVTLRREIGGKVELRTYRVADISEGRLENVPLLPGDVLVVDERIF